MKKTIKVVVTAVASMLVLTSCDKEETVAPADLSSEIKAYVSTHFSTSTISSAILNTEGFTKTYDVSLSDDVQLEFNNKYEIIDIDAMHELPASVVPDKIKQYVATNYPSNKVVGWELERKNQQVNLDNDLDLEFTMQGDFIRIDH